jgi:ABC-type dipeptide/oligopeptide/nickel transport system ATPase component/ABC-type dipeptide/oligopeptide/nickel transport system permease subunit
MSVSTSSAGAAPTTMTTISVGARRRFLPGSPKLAVGLVLAGAIVAFGLIGPYLVANPSTVDNIGLTSPTGQHWLGTTQTGQDVFAQLAYATRGSLTVGLVVGVLTLVLSSFFGVVGAYTGGWVDEAFSLFTNVVLVIPGLPLVILISSYVPNKTIWLVSVVLAITSWAGSARVLRGYTLSLRARDYVLAARVAGEKRWRILLVEVLPNLVPLLASQVVFAVIFAILGEAGLSYLGLGASGSFTWGTMLYFAQNGLALRLGAWWWFVPPGLLLALFGAGLSLINFSIDEVINPKLRTQRRTGGRAARAVAVPQAVPEPGANEVPAVGDTEAGRGGTTVSTPAHTEPRVRPVQSSLVLTVEHFSIDYVIEPVVHAVKDVSLTLRRGEVLGLAGESGCGKSTLAYGIVRLLKPPAVITSGRAVFHSREGHDIDWGRLGPEELRATRWDKISMVFQGAMNSLNPVISIQAQLEDIFTTHRPEMSRRERGRRCGELLERVGVDRSRLRSYPHELSGGMRQRVMIAMAMALEPQIMIMDEPTTALDVVVQREILQEITRLRDELGFAVIFITHDLPLLLEISDRIAVMREGEIVELADAVSLYTDPQDAYTKQLLASFPSLTGERGGFLRGDVDERLLNLDAVRLRPGLPAGSARSVQGEEKQ